MKGDTIPCEIHFPDNRHIKTTWEGTQRLVYGSCLARQWRTNYEHVSSSQDRLADSLVLQTLVVVGSESQIMRAAYWQQIGGLEHSGLSPADTKATTNLPNVVPCECSKGNKGYDHQARDNWTNPSSQQPSLLHIVMWQYNTVNAPLNKTVSM